MRNRVLSLSLVAGIMLTLVAVGSAARPVQAQSTTVTCDSTLITLLYVAEHDYGFQSAMDVTKFDKGQLAPLFTSMMSSGSMMAATPGTMMATESAMMAATPGAMMATENAMMAGTPNAMMTELKSGVVQGEDSACTSLRAEVETYLMAKFTAAMH